MCTDASCGIAHGRGRPREGWVKVEADFSGSGREPRWYCSWQCLIEAAESEVGKLVSVDTPSLFD